MYEEISKGRLKIPKELNSDAKNLIEVIIKNINNYNWIKVLTES